MLFMLYSTQKNNLSDAEKYFKYALSLNRNYQPAIRGLGIISYKRMIIIKVLVN